MSKIEEYDIKDWVEDASTTSNKEFRQAVHTICRQLLQIVI